MDQASILLCLLALLGAGLVYACWTDWTSRTIPNELNAAIALAAPLYWYATGLSLWPDVGIQLAIAGVLFAIFAGCFALGMMGGGDVKLIAALGLWFPVLVALNLLVLMSLIGGVITLIYYVNHKARKSEGPVEVPYGIAIALAGLWVIYERYLNHFG